MSRFRCQRTAVFPRRYNRRLLSDYFSETLSQLDVCGVFSSVDFCFAVAGSGCISQNRASGIDNRIPCSGRAIMSLAAQLWSRR
jgi:hypothetical protein